MRIRSNLILKELMSIPRIVLIFCSILAISVLGLGCASLVRKQSSDEDILWPVIEVRAFSLVDFLQYLETCPEIPPENKITFHVQLTPAKPKEILKVSDVVLPILEPYGDPFKEIKSSLAMSQVSICITNATLYSVLDAVTVSLGHKVKYKFIKKNEVLFYDPVLTGEHPASVETIKNTGFAGPWNYEEQLHNAVAEADGIVLRHNRYGSRYPEDHGRVLLAITNVPEVKDFASRLVFEHTQPYRLVFAAGYPAIEWKKGTNILVAASVFAGEYILWTGFPGNAALTKESSAWLRQWLAANGIKTENEVLQDEIKRLRPEH